MLEKYPFLSIIYNKNKGSNIIVLIQLLSKYHISYYNINELKNNDLKEFFNMVQGWWNKKPLMPISLYYKESFDKFNYCKEYIETKDYSFVKGFPGVTLKNLSEKRIKRKVFKFE